MKSNFFSWNYIRRGWSKSCLFLLSDSIIRPLMAIMKTQMEYLHLSMSEYMELLYSVHIMVKTKSFIKTRIVLFLKFSSIKTALQFRIFLWEIQIMGGLSVIRVSLVLILSNKGNWWILIWILSYWLKLLKIFDISILTFVLVIGGDCQNRVLNVLILVHLSLVEALVEIGRIVVLVSNPDTDELGHWKSCI